MGHSDDLHSQTPGIGGREKERGERGERDQGEKDSLLSRRRRRPEHGKLLSKRCACVRARTPPIMGRSPPPMPFQFILVRRDGGICTVEPGTHAERSLALALSGPPIIQNSALT